MTGEFSLSLDKLRIPIGVRRDRAVSRMEVEGKLVLHHISTEVRNPMRRAIIQMVADMNGKHASDVVTLAQDTEIRFRVHEGRLHHEGLRFGFRPQQLQGF
jgi:CO/xanthine dehydrogenase Mo-binding subunit